MHRSGTSLTASWLQNCGLQIDDGNLMGKGIGNVNGHFEDEDFVHFHEQLICLNDTKSKGWIVFERVPINESDFQSKALKLIKNRSRKFQLWGWKDPRTTIFLPEWNSCHDGIFFLLIWRDPCQVVSSLIRRANRSKNVVNRISLIRALQIWKFYNKCILNFYKSNYENCVLVDFSTLPILNRDLLNLINSEVTSSQKLNYFDFNKLYDSSLTKTKTNSMLIHILVRIFGLRSIQKDLVKMSYKGR
ncbi:hypothetical protein BST85_02350 [Aureitalea marina]|uniref:Sulfotransferase family protein n=1 Tax=Aureitalea marina TaxID=930804 RepID=A0A2S7KMT0_9FLAO|nr:hypothetical protein BST85_02350 [Aureitalea marina]